MRFQSYFLILMALNFSCGNVIDKENVEWEFIEVSYDNGWSGGSSVYLNNDQTYTKCNYKIISSINDCECFTSKLTKKQSYNLNSIIDSLKIEIIDTLYDGKCEDCGAFFINAKLKNTTLQSTIIDSKRFDNTLSKFAKLIYELPTGEKRVDSCVVFETTKKLVPPLIKLPEYIELPPN